MAHTKTINYCTSFTYSPNKIINITSIKISSLWIVKILCLISKNPDSDAARYADEISLLLYRGSNWHHIPSPTDRQNCA